VQNPQKCGLTVALLKSRGGHKKNKKSLRLPSYWLVSLIILVLPINLAFAEEQIFSGEEIKATLSGHEIKGI
jgi:hypothetical protein